jgi:hypothetical protein
MGCIIALCGLWAIHSALAPQQVEVFCDQKIAPETRTLLRTLLVQRPVKSLGASGILKELQQLFPVVRGVTIQTNAARKALVTITSHHPQVLIASVQAQQLEYALCKDVSQGKKVAQDWPIILIEKKYFSDAALHELPRFIVDTVPFADALHNAELLSCVRDMDSALFDEFIITWKATSEIVLRSKTMPMLIIADVVAIHDKERLSAAKRIYNAEKDSYKNGIKADIRLRESIVCSQWEGAHAEEYVKAGKEVAKS